MFRIVLTLEGPRKVVCDFGFRLIHQASRVPNINVSVFAQALS